jgi:RNA polymerase sigma factor for flagellar operon FliA
MQLATQLNSWPAPVAPPKPRSETPGSATILNLDGLRKKRLVSLYAPLVERLVHRALIKARYYCDAGELRSAAYLGLIDAAQRYDASRHVPFDAFAQHRINGAILDEMRSRDTLARPTRRRARALELTRTRLTRSLQREPTESELALASGEDLETFRTRAARERAQSVLSLDDVSPRGWEARISSSMPSTLDALCAHERRTELAAAVAQLPERLRGIIKSYYEDDRSYHEIGAVLGVSESRVCQLLKGAHRMLRDRLAPA